MLFDRLETQLKPTPYAKLIENVFGGQTCTTLVCEECKKEIHRFEGFNNLSLDVKNLKNVKDSLDQFTQQEQIQDYFCEQCQKKQDIVKTVSISDCPNYLIIHLKRIVFDFETMENEKVNSYFEFSQVNPFIFQEMDISPYCKSKSAAQVYSLIGVVVHIGVAQFGHYVSYIRTGSDCWLEFNDSLVSPFDPQQIEKQCFGGARMQNFTDMDLSNKSAYMLIYEKKEKGQFILQGQDLRLPNQHLLDHNKDLFTVQFHQLPDYVPRELHKQI